MDFLQDYLIGHGISCCVLPGPEGDRSNLFATIGDPSKPGYVLSGHVDVVPAGEAEWLADPFVLRRDGERRDCCINRLRPTGEVDGLSVSCGFEQMRDELDLPRDAWFFVMNMAAFDGSDCFDAAEGRLGGSQRPEALAISEWPFHGGMVALDQVVSPLSINMPDAVEVRIVSVIDLTNDAPIAMRLVQEGFGRLRIPSCGQAKIHHLTVCIDGAP